MRHAYAALTRIALAARTVELEFGEGQYPLIVPFKRLMVRPVPILRHQNKVAMFRQNAITTIAAQTVVLGSRSFGLRRSAVPGLVGPVLFGNFGTSASGDDGPLAPGVVGPSAFGGNPFVVNESRPLPVDRADPLIRYSPDLKKVVYNCAAQPMLDIEQILGDDIKGLRDQLIVAFVFHPCGPEGILRQRATLCDALLLVIRHTNVRLLVVNVEALPESTFPFSPSDWALKVAAEDRLPHSADKVESVRRSVEAFVHAAQTASRRNDVVERVEILSMDEYRDRVGSWRFEIETLVPVPQLADTRSHAMQGFPS